MNFDGFYVFIPVILAFLSISRPYIVEWFERFCMFLFVYIVGIYFVIGFYNFLVTIWFGFMLYCISMSLCFIGGMRETYWS